MYRDAFEREYLKTKNIPQAILLYGASHFLIDHYTERILQTLNAKEDEIHRLYFDEYHAKTIQALLMTQSLFAPRRIILLKIEKKIPKKDLKDFFTCLPKNPHAYFVVAFYAAENKDAKSYMIDCKELELGFKKGVSVRFFAPHYQESISLIKSLATSYQLDIEERLLMEIFKIQNGDLMLIQSDLKKLSTLDRKIQLADIQTLVHGVSHCNIEDLCLSLFERKHALALVERALDTGMTGREIISGMEAFFMKLFLVFSYTKTHGKTDIIDILGYKPPINIEKQYKELSIRLKEEHYQEIFEIFQNGFLGLLKGGHDPLQELYSCLIKLQVVFK